MRVAARSAKDPKRATGAMMCECTVQTEVMRSKMVAIKSEKENGCGKANSSSKQRSWEKKSWSWHLSTTPVMAGPESIHLSATFPPPDLAARLAFLVEAQQK